MTGAAKNTVVKLLVELGTACAKYQQEALRNLPCKRLQLDEIWCFCYCKDKNVPEEKQGLLGYGDVWTWIAIDADSKLVPSWLVGKRDAAFAEMFVNDVASRLSRRVQVTTDGLKTYLAAMEGAFGCDVDYAMLIKLYGAAPPEPNTRYSPAECTGITIKKIAGNPDEARISTSYIERQNLTVRMGMRRFTRLTNAFSKKIENLEHAVAIHYMHYNFVRRHQTLRVTPAMEAGVTMKWWTVEDMVKLLD
jgi:IS1 family transposase